MLIFYVCIEENKGRIFAVTYVSMSTKAGSVFATPAGATLRRLLLLASGLQDALQQVILLDSACVLNKHGM